MARPASPSCAGPGGAHNWQPMSFSPHTGLVYIPVTEMAFPYVPDAKFKTRIVRLEHGSRLRRGKPAAG